MSEIKNLDTIAEASEYFFKQTKPYMQLMMKYNCAML